MTVDIDRCTECKKLQFHHFLIEPPVRGGPRLHAVQVPRVGELKLVDKMYVVPTSALSFHFFIWTRVLISRLHDEK